MKAIINWFKDLFYNATDYAIIFCVIAVVAVVLFWRFDILFNLKVDKDVLKPNPINISDNSDSKKPDSNNDNSDSNPSDENKDKEDNPNGDNNQEGGDNNPTPDDKTPDNASNQNDIVPDGTEISFTVPEGSFPSKIADILIDKKLITDKQLFLNRSMELKLDTKLKSGDFKIKKGTPLDDVIKIIAKQN